LQYVSSKKIILYDLKYYASLPVYVVANKENEPEELDEPIMFPGYWLLKCVDVTEEALTETKSVSDILKSINTNN